MKKVMCFMLVLCLLALPIGGAIYGICLNASINGICAEEGLSDYYENSNEEYYVVFDEFDNFLFEGVGVEVGDEYINKDFQKYEVYMIDQTSHIAKAKYVETLEKPNVSKISDISKISAKNKTIALYLTHNDESYVIGDGYDSVYGKGGIHDVAKKLKSELEKKGVNVVLDETLHIPHNSTAYDRSKPTAQKLISTHSPSAIFDIHRDGVSRSAYVTKYGGKERSRIKIVIGQANPNKDANLQLALYMMSVAETICPWLFTEIYYAKGHYNQALSSKSLLFEMGTYLIEKSYVLDAVPSLAEVIATTLFGTEVDEATGDLTITNNPTEEKTIDYILDKTSPSKMTSGAVISVIIASLVIAGVLGYIGYKYLLPKLKKGK